jgi:hypothetical protein
MNKATREMRAFAERLTIYDACENETSETSKSLSFPFSNKLHLHLATLMGAGEFQAFLSRSLALAAVEVSWLDALRVKPDGSLDGLDKFETQLDPQEYFEGRIVLLAHLLGMLMAFIGEALTLRLLCEVWPKIPLSELDLANGGKNEK